MTLAAQADYPTFSSARAHLKDVLDSAGRGDVVTIARSREVSVASGADRLRSYLFSTVASNVEVAHEDGRSRGAVCRTSPQ